MPTMAKSDVDKSNGETEYTTVGITVPARDCLTEFCKRRHGMTLRDVISTLATWLPNEPPVVQRVVLSEVPDGLELAYAEALDKMAHDLRVKALDGKERGTHAALKQPAPPSAESERPGGSKAGEAGEAKREVRRPARQS